MAETRAETETAERLFQTCFRPLYPADLRDNDEALVRARGADANPAKNPSLYVELDEIAEVFARVAPRALGDIVFDRSDASVHRLAATLDRTKRDALRAEGSLVQLVIHAAVYVGACIVRNHGGVWGVRRPLWESVVTLTSRAGVGDLSPFAWLLKSLSDAEIDRGGLSSRYRLHVERSTARPEELPRIVRDERKLPALKHVRYDTLHKYLVAHLPELRDLGRDFPSPEQFAEIGFLGLELMLLADGRLLLMHGLGKAGLHLMWLEANGFSHARFFPADPGSPHSVRVEGDRLIVTFDLNGEKQVHEMLFWG